jgi:hypothetical protein
MRKIKVKDSVKTTEIQIDLTKVAAALSKTLPEEKKKALQRALRPQLADLKSHFKKDGWDLCLEYIVSDVTSALLGYDLWTQIASTLCKQGYQVVTSKKPGFGFVVRKPKTKKAKK